MESRNSSNQNVRPGDLSNARDRLGEAGELTQEQLDAIVARSRERAKNLAQKKQKKRSDKGLQ